MLDVSVEMKGINRVKNQLRTLAALHPEITDPIIAAHAKKERARLKSKPYPPRLPNQKYVRTGLLANKFAHRKLGPGKHSVANTRPNGIYVIKKGWQNRQYHLGRWWTIEDALDENMPELTKNLTKALDAKLKAATD